MNNLNINNTLAELEDNLKKMDSARAQVTSLSSLVSNLTSAYSNTLVQLQKIESSIHFDEDYFANKFGKSINQLDHNISLLKSKAIDHNNSMNSIHAKASKDFILSLNKSEDKVKIYVSEFKPSFEKVKNDFKNRNQEIIADLNKKINEFTETSTEKIEEIKSLDLLKEIINIDETITQINSNFEKVSISLENINNSSVLHFEKLQSENIELKEDIKSLDLFKEINNIEHTIADINSNVEKASVSLENIENSSVVNFKKLQSENNELKDAIKNLEEEIKNLDLLTEINNIDKNLANISSNSEKLKNENNELKEEIKTLKQEINIKLIKSELNFKILLSILVVILIVIIALRIV